MKKSFLFILSLVLMQFSAKAQTVNVPFSVNGAGKALPIEWGMDAAWDWDYNVMRGVAHYGTGFTTGRISFQPYNLVDASKINDASANFGLSAGQVRKLQWRIDLIKRTGATKVNINCDHEVLVRKMDDEGNYSDALGNDNVGKGNYVSTSRTGYKTTEWVNLIKATVKYTQAQGLEVISVSPFNEPDYGWNQYYNGGNGTNESNQNNYGIPTFKAIAQAIKGDSFFDGIRVCGGNTLNCDRAAVWYDGLKDYLDEGNTHQLAGSFDNYANFFKKVRDDGKVATADEVHNVGEAMVGVQYGMQNAIWWGFDSKARGQFMHDSNEGKRIGYAEDRSRWTSAAVYRNEKDNEIHGFIGSSERQANVSTYNFQCQDREVYFNGFGPQKEWSVTTVGGASGSYQNGQINYEYLFDITYGEDVQSAPVDGNYQIMSAADMKLVTSNGAWSGSNHLSATDQANDNTQRWHVYPDHSDGDCSYWFIDNVGDATQHWNLLNGGGAGALAAGSRVICYNAGHDALEQWYLRYAKDGYFYIMARQSNKYLYNDNGTLTLQDAPTKSTGANTLKKYMWRLMPTDATAEQAAPAAPSGLAEGTSTSASASITWTAVDGESKAVTYNVLRQDANGWNTIARLQSGTSYTDTKVEAGRAYRYKVQAVDYSGNRSEMSDAIMVMVPEDSEDVPTYTAGQWEWIGETASNGTEAYILNKSTKTFITHQNTLAAEGTLWSMSSTGSGDNVQWTIKCKDATPHFLYVKRTGKSANSLNASNFTAYANGQNLSTNNTLSTTFWIKGDANGYTFNSYLQYKDNTAWIGNNAASGDIYIGSNSANLATGIQSNSSADTYKWLIISENQMSKYSMVSDYTTAFNTAKGYLSMDLSSELMSELTSTLDACDGTINYNNIEQYIKNLKAIIEKCSTYIEANPGTPDEVRTDFTGLIINPTIIQNGSTNDAPTGWVGASTNVTGNGHWTEGTGDTRLEAWNWSTNPNGLSADYYQDIIVPNGLYTLSAVTHQRANGDAALYAETYKSFETTMPVGDGNEAQTDVTTILVTDGCIRIGIKGSNNYTGVDNQWMTADDFTLTRVSTPENTDLSHYTDAIAYLNTIAESELTRNIDHTELQAALDAANNCEANASAYEVAINNLVAAIKKSQATVETVPVLPGSWIGQTGGYAGDCAERYNGDTPYSEGRILYQVVEDLIPGALYEIEFYAVANVARNLSSQYYGSDIAYLFANDTEEDIDVIYQEGCTPTNYPRKLTAIADENGQIAYGIANRKAGGQWYVAKAKSITFIGVPETAYLAVSGIAHYGTFIAPFDVTLPENITAYKVTEISGDDAVIKEIKDEKLLANTAVILYNPTNQKIECTYKDIATGTPNENSGEYLVGVYEDKKLSSDEGYIMQYQNGECIFLKGNNQTVSKNRAYLSASKIGNSKIRMVFADETTTIAVTEVVEGISAIYSLSGVKLDKMQKGVNIIKMSNGVIKKVIVK